MSELLKILAGVVIGLACGLVSALWIEPLKQKRQLKEEATVAQQAIFNELGRAFELLHYATSEARRTETLRFVDFPEFDYYYHHRREVLYEVRYWQEIVDFVRELRTKQQWPVSDTVPLATIGYDMMQSFWDRTNRDSQFSMLIVKGRTHACEQLKKSHMDYAAFQRRLETNRL